MSMPTETTLWDSSNSNTLDPGSVKKALGWVTDEQPASTTFNWLFIVIESWLAWLSGIYGYATTWTNTHFFSAAVTTDILNNTGKLNLSGALNISKIAALAAGSNPNTMSNFASYGIQYYSGTGACVVTLPSAPSVGDTYLFNNSGPGSLQVLCFTGMQIDGSSASIGVTLSGSTTAKQFTFIGSGTWIST